MTALDESHETELTPHQRAYVAGKVHPANNVDRQWLDKDGLDYDAIRQRIEFIGLIYSQPLAGFPEPCDPAEIKRLVRMTDRSLGRRGYIFPFVDKYGVDLNWLFLGDLTTLLMDARTYHNNRTAVDAAVERRQAVGVVQ